jgi:hypothetical protein
MKATIHHLPTASTYPDPSVITSAAEHFTSGGFTPEDVAGAYSCDPSLASALRTAMERGASLRAMLEEALAERDVLASVSAMEAITEAATWKASGR